MSELDTIFRLTILMFFLLNPFLIIVYLTDLVQNSSLADFAKIIFRASVISASVFILFAYSGNYIFSNIIQVRFSSFLIFGGLIFLIIGFRFVFYGNKAILMLRGEPEQITGSIVMPIMIGPGTISASVFCGERLSGSQVVLPIVIAIFLFGIILILLKSMHDSVKTRNEKLVERYIEVTGRVASLVIGTYAVEMITQGAIDIVKSM